MSGMYTSEEMEQAVEGTEQHVNQMTGEIHQPQQPRQEARPTPQKPTFYDHTKEDNPELRKKAMASFNITLKEAGMDENHRHALAWGAGYEGSSRNVPSPVLKQWTTAMKAKPEAWKKRAEELMKDYQSVQEEHNLEEQREAEYYDTLEGEYVEVDELWRL